MQISVDSTVGIREYRNQLLEILVDMVQNLRNNVGGFTHFLKPESQNLDTFSFFYT